MVDHSTADREVGGSIPLAPCLRIVGRVKQPCCIFSEKSNMKNRAVFKGLKKYYYKFHGLCNECGTTIGY